MAYATDDPPVVRGGWTYRLDARRVVAGGALSNGGNVIAWLRRTFPAVDPAALWDREAGDDGLIALPLLVTSRIRLTRRAPARLILTSWGSLLAGGCSNF